jgi:hypothetical protein
MYRSAGATEPGKARDPEELGIAQRVPFALLVQHAVLREAASGRFYLDEPSWGALRRTRRRVALIILVALAVVFVSGALVFVRRV